MPAFLDEYSYFAGDGSRNEDGLSLDEFLEGYNCHAYDRPSVTADILVFGHDGGIYEKIKADRSGAYTDEILNGLTLLMVKRRNHPSIGYWALPGGFCEIHEDFIQSARRELYEETGLADVPMELINTFGEEKRDPRYRIITGAFLALVDRSEYTPVAGDDAADARWFSINLKEELLKEVDRGSTKAIRTVYDILLTSMDDDRIECSARVAVTSNKGTILKETSYEVLENHNIAFDHARFIANGLMHINRGIAELS